MVPERSIQNDWGTAIIVVVVLNLSVFSPQISLASNSVVTDSSDSELEEGSTSQSSPPANLAVKTIDDLFLNYSSDLSRLRAAYNLIGDADEAKLLELFDQVTVRKFTEEDTSWRAELISLISTQLAPKNLTKTVSLYESQSLADAKYMLYGVMHAWASEDFDGAVKFARKQDDSIHYIALRGIVDASLGLPEETLIDLGIELGDKKYVERALSAYQLKLDLADPDKAWANLRSDPTINREENFFRSEQIAIALIDKYGAAETDDLLNSITSPALSFKLRKSILSNIALSEPETAFNFALDTPNDVFGSTLSSVVETWANTDPQSALTRVRLLEPSTVRDRLQQIVVSSWVQLDPSAFLVSVDNIPIELQDTARVSLVAVLSKGSIEDSLTVLPDIEDDAMQEEATLLIVDSWLDSNPDAVFQWILSNPENERYRNRLLSSFLEKFTQRDANKAFDLALSQPIAEEKEVGLEAIVIDNLSFSDTDLALSLLNKVRPGVTQLAALESISTGLIFDNRTVEALELGKTLSGVEQISYYNNLAFLITTQEPLKKILEIISDVPVQEAQSKIAEHILIVSSVSDEDVETLLEYVAPADLQRVKMLLRR